MANFTITTKTYRLLFNTAIMVGDTLQIHKNNCRSYLNYRQRRRVIYTAQRSTRLELIDLMTERRTDGKQGERGNVFEGLGHDDPLGRSGTKLKPLPGNF